jgi:hypothetical protein
MASISGRRQFACLALTILFGAAACTTDQGGYSFLGINQSDQDAVITLDTSGSMPTRLAARTKAGIASGWSYVDGPALIAMDALCSVLGSMPVVGPSTVLIIAADGTLKTDPDRRVFDHATERLVSAQSDWTCQPFRVSNRTNEDVVFRFGDQPRAAVFVPACRDVAFDPSQVQHLATPPPTAVVVRYEFAPGQPALTPTVTITAIGVSIAYLASSSPCRGLAPTSTPDAS